MDLWVTNGRGCFWSGLYARGVTTIFIGSDCNTSVFRPCHFSSHVLFRPSAARDTRRLRRSNGEKAKGQYRLGQKFFERVVIDTELISNWTFDPRRWPVNRPRSGFLASSTTIMDGMQTIPGNDWKHAVLCLKPQIRNCCEQLNFQTTINNQMYSTSSQILQRDKVKLNYLPAQNKIKPSNEWIMISSANFRETYSYGTGMNSIKPFPGNRKCQETLLCGLNSMSTLPLPEW